MSPKLIRSISPGEAKLTSRIATAERQLTVLKKAAEGAKAEFRATRKKHKAAKKAAKAAKKTLRSLREKLQLAAPGSVPATKKTAKKRPTPRPLTLRPPAAPETSVASDAPPAH